MGRTTAIWSQNAPVKGCICTFFTKISLHFVKSGQNIPKYQGEMSNFPKFQRTGLKSVQKAAYQPYFKTIVNQQRHEW